MKKIIIVGAGFSGSIIARKIAEELDIKVTVIERRKHIGGNAYDEYDENGILIQKYGPHFLNTNNYFIIKFLMQYSELFQHNTKLLSFLDEQYIRLPFNFQSVQELLGAERSETVINKLRKNFPGRDRVPVLEMVDCTDTDVSAFGTLLFEKAFKTYTSKMWGTDINKIDKYVLERVPFAMNYDERYLNKDFQYLPKNGFTKLFENMLNHKNIEVELDSDAFEHISFDEKNSIIKYDSENVDLLVFTGAIDELFGLKYGRLPYRSLDIQYEYFNEEKVLSCEIISYPQADGYTRKTEYKQFTYEMKKCNKTVVATEYPLEYDPADPKANIPYYPVLTEESQATYKKYLDEAKKYGNIFLCGRLAEFKYYNMDICIEHALEKFEEIKEKLK